MLAANVCEKSPKHFRASDKLIAASVQWAEEIMEKIDNVFRSSDLS
jgi:hypothetical protein